MIRENPGQMTAKIQRWLSDILSGMRKGGVAKVSRDVAKARAKICEACPMQRAYSAVCNSCSSQRRLAIQLILDGKAPVNPRLKACLVLEIDTALAVHLELGRDAVPGLPPVCWRRDGP